MHSPKIQLVPSIYQIKRERHYDDHTIYKVMGVHTYCAFLLLISYRVTNYFCLACYIHEDHSDIRWLRWLGRFNGTDSPPGRLSTHGRTVAFEASRCVPQTKSPITLDPRPHPLNNSNQFICNEAASRYCWIGTRMDSFPPGLHHKQQ